VHGFAARCHASVPGISHEIAKAAGDAAGRLLATLPARASTRPWPFSFEVKGGRVTSIRIRDPAGT
jgi:hypothetical protein